MATASNSRCSLAALVLAAFAADHEPPPCFYWATCRQRAALEKAGRSVCRRCSASLRGAEYPLRNPCPEPMYKSDRVAAEALDMLETAPRRSGASLAAPE
jgi:hypothetical protein